jgi:hypothetical protein
MTSPPQGRIDLSEAVAPESDMTLTQKELAAAERDFEIAKKDYEAAAHQVRESAELSTHERAALTARKAEAWNALEAARKRLAEVEARVIRPES